MYDASLVNLLLSRKVLKRDECFSSQRISSSWNEFQAVTTNLFRFLQEASKLFMKCL